MNATSSLLVLLSAANSLGATPEAIEWVKHNAVPLATVEAGHGFNDLAAFGKIVGEARIVSLGEPTHGTREAFQLKHRLIEYLASEKGFTIFSIEANMPEAYRLNAYVAGGEGDPNELIAGMYFWTWNTEEVLDMVQWMRRYNAEHPGRPKVQFTGFDMQTSDVAAKIALEFIQKHAPDLAESARPALENVAKMRTSPGAGAFGVATGSFPADAVKGKKLTFAGWVRTDNLTDGWAGLWWRADGPKNEVLAFNNMQQTGPKGTTDWTRYEFSLNIPEQTTNINFGVIMPGSGTAWFDDLEVLIDGKPYVDPEKFSFDFENDNVRYLRGMAPGYEVKRVQEQPHAGTTCLRLRSVSDGPAIDPDAVEAAAKSLVETLNSRRDGLIKSSSEREADWAIQNARVVAQCATMTKAGMSGGALRDVSMADNVSWILEHNPGAKVVLWAHNGHVSQTLHHPWGQRFMGSHLVEKFPGQIVAVGFATGSGSYTAVGADSGKLGSDHKLADPPRDSIEAALHESGVQQLLLDIRSAKADDPATAWLVEPRPMRSIGAVAMDQQFFTASTTEQFDVLAYIDQTTASRPLSKKQPAP